MKEEVINGEKRQVPLLILLFASCFLLFTSLLYGLCFMVFVLRSHAAWSFWIEFAHPYCWYWRRWNECHRASIAGTR